MGVLWVCSVGVIQGLVHLQLIMKVLNCRNLCGGAT